MNFKKIILVSSLMLCILFSISCIAASEVNDTLTASDVSDAEIADIDENQVLEQTDDDTIANGDTGSFTELQAKILVAPDGSTITLDKDYSFNTNANVTTGVIINKNLTIDGNGHTLNGMSKSRILTVLYNIKENNKVVLKNIVFKNGFSEIYGGAIINFADLTIEDCTFTNNYAHTAGGAINSLGSLTLKNSKFTKNTAGGDAGAVFTLNIGKNTEIFSTIDISKLNMGDISSLLTLLMDNTITLGKDYISNCVFTSNVAEGNGGGAVYAFSHIDIDSSTFKSNTADEKGAAVYGCKDLYIHNSKFSKNTVGMYGGAVYFKCHEQSGSYQNGTWVSSVKFYSNLIEKSVFANNVAGERGGAIYGFKASQTDNVHCAQALKCTFSDNTSPNGKDIYGGTLINCVYKNTQITLKTVTIKKSAKKLVLKAKLKKGSSPLKGKKVKFKFNGKTYKAKTNSKGIAKYTIKKSVLKKLEVGKKVTYKASYKSFSDKKSTKVKK